MFPFAPPLWKKPVAGSNTISFIGSQGVNSTTIDLSATGRASGDIIVLVDQAFDPSGVSDVTPSGFTRIGTSLTASSPFFARANQWWKISTGSEGSITGMAGGFGADKVAFVLRKSGGTWQTPASVGAAMNLAGNATAQTITAITAPFFAIGSANAIDSTSDLSFSPAADGTVFNGQDLTMAYKIYNSGGSNITLASNANRSIIAGFAVAVA